MKNWENHLVSIEWPLNTKKYKDQAEALGILIHIIMDSSVKVLSKIDQRSYHKKIYGQTHTKNRIFFQIPLDWSLNVKKCSVD